MHHQCSNADDQPTSGTQSPLRQVAHVVSDLSTIKCRAISRFRAVGPTCRFFYASSACIYPEGKQLNTEVEGGGLKEEDAWPAQVRSRTLELHTPSLSLATANRWPS